MGIPGLRMMHEAAQDHGLLTVSEVMEISQIEPMLPYVDCFQVGARNMQNFNLLRELGQMRKPVLLKRGIAATIEELLLSSEYIMAGGNYDVILCERGIRTYETSTRNTMDISAIPVIHKLSHLPIVGDPSHGTGRRDMVAPMAQGRSGRGRGRDSGRGSSQRRQSRLRRRADAVPRPVRGADGRVARDCHGGGEDAVTELSGVACSSANTAIGKDTHDRAHRHLRHGPAGHLSGLGAARRRVSRLHHRLEPQRRRRANRAQRWAQSTPSPQTRCKPRARARSSLLAVPIYATLDWMEKLSGVLGSEHLVTDVGSTKAPDF